MGGRRGWAGASPKTPLSSGLGPRPGKRFSAGLPPLCGLLLVSPVRVLAAVGNQAPAL